MPTTTFNLDVRRRPELLNRVVCLCRRRGIEIVALNYGEGEMSLSVSGDQDTTRRIRYWLGALVDVLEVREHNLSP